MLKREDGASDYALSVYDVRAGKTIAQVGVGSKENESTKAPEAIQLAKIAGKVVTGDALHTQKRLAQTILEECFSRERKPSQFVQKHPSPFCA